MPKYYVRVEALQKLKSECNQLFFYVLMTIFIPRSVVKMFPSIEVGWSEDRTAPRVRDTIPVPAPDQKHASSWSDAEKQTSQLTKLNDVARVRI